MLIRKIGDWAKVRDMFDRIPKQLDKAVDQAVAQEAQFLRGKMVEGLREQAPAGKALQPLSPATIATRRLKGFRGTKALIKRGDLRNAIAVVKEPGGIFIGVHRTAKAKNGKSVVDLAAIHEFGGGPMVIKVTPRMRRFLMAAFRKAGLAGQGRGTGIIVTRIPARPFIRPIFEKWGPKSKDRIGEKIGRLLAGAVT